MRNRTVHGLPVWPSSKKPARGLPAPPAWAPGPTADGWAGEAAQRRLPPGLKVAQPAARRTAAVDLRSTVENTPAQNGPI
jgi:hypothetical protein